MAQLSTDTLLYSQIISKVQDFLLKYNVDKNTEYINFDEDYKKLLIEIEKSIGKPISQVDFFQKGEIPSSEKINKITTNISSDINIIMNQFDSLVANYISSFNQIMSEIESEKNFLSRIRSKISALEIYSNSSARNIIYMGDNFNNLDYVDVTRIKQNYLPDVSDGFACLPRRSLRKPPANIRVVNQNYDNQQNRDISYVDVSNGFKGSSHLHFVEEENNNPFIFEKDTSNIRSNELALIDESPATYLEYESLNVLGTNDRPSYEFEYGLSSSNNNQRYVSWANADTSNPLKLTIELDLKSKNGEYINHISIIPFFGYSNIDLIKNIKVSSVKFYNEQDNTIAPLISETNSFYIGSDIFAPSLSLKNRYFYNKGVLRFEKIKANKVYITFEQSQFNDVSIKHAYWTPYETKDLANTPATSTPWKDQQRFIPSAIVSDSENYRVEDVSWNKASVVPYVNEANRIKSSTTDIYQAKIKYWQRSQKNFSRIKVTQGQSIYYFTNDRINKNSIKVRVFTTNRSAAASYNQNSSFLPSLKTSLLEETDSLRIVLPENQDINSYIDLLKKSVNSFEAGSGSAIFYVSEAPDLEAGDKVFINLSSSTDLVNKGIYTISSISPTSFSISVDPSINIPLQQVTGSFYVKQDFSFAENEIDIENFQDLSDNQISKDIFLKKNFEYLKAKRAAIGIRDLYVGSESYFDICEIVSKPYRFYNKLDLVSLQVEEYIPTEKDSSGQILGSSSIDYYISVDNGAKWIKISPIERSFEGVPEIIAFNQNLSSSEQLPQIAYFNSPEVPQEIESIIFRAIIKKDRNVMATPILYSYKLGLKVS
jgi:hypothetical protein